MSVEDRLRDSLRAAAAGAEPTSQMWDAVLARTEAVRARRRAQRLVVVGLSAAAVIAIVAGVFLGGDRERRGDITQEPGEGPMPAHIVTVEDDRVLVRSSDDGRILRVLAEGGDLGNLQQVAVSPDGSEVYIARYVPIECPGASADTARFRGDILRVAIGGGPVEVVVTNGGNPSVSPLGNYLAYVSDGTTDGCGSEHRLVRSTIGVPDTEVTLSSAQSDTAALVPLSWTRDETMLLAEGLPPESGGRELFTIEGLPDEPRVTKVRFPDQPRDQLEAPAVILGPRLVAAPLTIDGATYVVTFDPKTGQVQERLFEIPERPEYLEGSGGAFLAGVEAAEGYTLVRWDDDRGLKSFDDLRLRDLGWARGPTTPPAHLVALTPDGKLEVRETTSGDVVRTIRAGIDLSYGPPRIAVSPDGRYVYMDKHGLRDCPDPARRYGDIARVSISNGDVEVVATARDPAISPDGSKLAYVLDGCGSDDRLAILDLASGRESRYPANPAEPAWGVSTPHWSPDGRMMIVTLTESDESSTRLFDTIEPDESLADAHRVETADFTGVHGYLTEDELLAFETPEDSSDIVTIDPVSGVRKRFLVRMPGVHHQIGIDASSDGENVLFVLRDPAASSEAAPSSAFRYPVGGLESVTVADDVLSVAWLERFASDQRAGTP